MTDSDRSLWDLWLMLWRAKEAADTDALLHEDDSDFPDTLPIARPDPE